MTTARILEYFVVIPHTQMLKLYNAGHIKYLSK